MADPTTGYSIFFNIGQKHTEFSFKQFTETLCQLDYNLIQIIVILVLKQV